MNKLLLLLLLFCGSANAAINVASYGAKCNSVADDTGAISAAVAEAQRTQQALFIPPGGCKYSQTITLTVLVPIIGEGRNVSRLIYTGSGDAIHVRPQVGANNVGHAIRDVDISPNHPGGGRYAIHVELAPMVFYAYWNFDRISTGDFGGRALWLNNTVGNVDGFFNGQTTHSFLRNGVLGTLIGDSVQFNDTVIHGRNNVDLSGLSGAVMSGIRGGQITTENGFLILRNVHGFRVRDVWFETPNSRSLSENSVIVIQSTGVQFSGLTINAGSQAPPVHIFVLLAAVDTRIENTAFITAGIAAHVYGVVSTVRTTVSGNTYNGVLPVVNLQGS